MAETAAEKAQRLTDLAWGSKIAIVLATAGLITGIVINDVSLMTCGIVTGSFALFFLSRTRPLKRGAAPSGNANP